MIGKNKERSNITLPKKTWKLIDKVRGKRTRSQFIDTAVYVFVANAAMLQAAKEKSAEIKAQKEKIKNA